ncbi:uncharacterized protein LOC142139679 isoform X2 [Mixophyes fleayi]|uniref:uncharacterized protein LOC142139679 isoform X2 n=1 Tax=Mixophyes fleayi TaxID=3061075 RepID=UPI003F4DA253
MSWTRLCLLLLVSVQCRAQRNELSGDDVTLTAVFTGVPDEITWTLNGNKIVEFNKDSGTYYYQHWSSRADGDLTGRLTIRNLSLADSGTFKAEVIIGGEIQPTERSVRVYDHVCMPIITTHKEGNNVTLGCTCSTPDATYEWLNGSRVMSTEQTITVVRHPGDKEENVTCVVRNLVSKNNQTVPLQAVPVNGGSSVRLTVGLIVPFALVGAGLVWYFFIRKSECLKSEQTQRQKDLMDEGMREPLNRGENSEQAPRENHAGQPKAADHVENGDQPLQGSPPMPKGMREPLNRGENSEQAPRENHAGQPKAADHVENGDQPLQGSPPMPKGQPKAADHVENGDQPLQGSPPMPKVNAGGINGDKVPEHSQEDNSNNTDL